jgi:uncharacterized protein
MNAYQVFMHFNNLIFSKKMKAGWLLSMFLLGTTACLSPAVFDIKLTEYPLFTSEPAAPEAQEVAPAPAEMVLAAAIETMPPAATQTPSFVLTPPPEPVRTAAEEVVEEPEQDIETEQLQERGPYWHLSIEHLLERSYGAGEIEIHQVLGGENGFTRYLFSYPSDDLVIYGFANVPAAEAGPYPVVIALHGYVDPAVYRTLPYTTQYADMLAQAGFLVLHPNLRNYPLSSSGENMFRVGMAIDVLNLIAIMEKQAGKPGLFEHAMPDSIGLWGHSMGGGISLRVSVINPTVKATVLYGAMSGDERQNFAAIYEWSDNQRGLDELAVPVEEIAQIAPIHFLDQIHASISIHHGEDDQMVPLQWSLDLCRNLIELGMEPECFTYPGQRHTFNQTGNLIFMERIIDFFNRNLKQ